MNGFAGPLAFKFWAFNMIVKTRTLLDRAPVPVTVQSETYRRDSSKREQNVNCGYFK
jgi:hypothetical protein